MKSITPGLASIAFTYNLVRNDTREGALSLPIGIGYGIFSHSYPTKGSTSKGTSKKKPKGL